MTNYRLSESIIKNVLNQFQKRFNLTKLWEKKRDQYIKSALRRIWRWSPNRCYCLSLYECALCFISGRKRKYYADHISPVVDPRKGFQGWDNYIERLFNGRLQPLCKTCHTLKSKEEN